MPSQADGNVALLQWQMVCKLGEDELHRPPMVALNIISSANTADNKNDTVIDMGSANQ